MRNGSVREDGEMEDVKKTCLGLLEYLSARAGCMYLSDLPGKGNLPVIQHTLRGMPSGMFGLREWNDAVCYITRQKRSFETEEQARQYLLNYDSWK